MKKQTISLILCFFLFFPSCFAMGIGVSPESLTFRSLDDVKTFSIFNPNDFPVDFNLKNDYFNLDPSEGTVLPGSRMQILAVPTEVFPDMETVILVETFVEDSGHNLGVIPAVGVRAFLDLQDDLTVLDPSKASEDLIVGSELIKSDPDIAEMVKGSGTLEIYSQHAGLVEPKREEASSKIFKKEDIIAMVILIFAISLVASKPFIEKRLKLQKRTKKSKRNYRRKRMGVR